MTAITCKSDCHFSQNSERKCSLEDITLQQMQRHGAKFVCNQYVESPVSSQRFNSVDVNISLNAGYEKGLRERLKK